MAPASLTIVQLENQSASSKSFIEFAFYRKKEHYSDEVADIIILCHVGESTVQLGTFFLPHWESSGEIGTYSTAIIILLQFNGKLLAHSSPVHHVICVIVTQGWIRVQLPEAWFEQSELELGQAILTYRVINRIIFSNNFSSSHVSYLVILLLYLCEITHNST